MADKKSSKALREELRGLKLDQLQARLKALRWHMAEMRLKHMKRQLDNPMQLRFARKEVARILTVMKGLS